MRQTQTRHPVCETQAPIDPDTAETMFELFKQIGVYWNNMKDAESCRSRLYTFMQNRINLRPIYRDYYIMARHTIKELIAEHGEQKAYEIIFTDPLANQPPAESRLAITRQKVSNEFVTLQLSLGGFKDFGAKNHLGYIGGAYIPGKPVPYRTSEE